MGERCWYAHVISKPKPPASFTKTVYYKPGSVLVLIDINGSLLTRCKEEIAVEPDFEIKYHKYYFRPGFKDFLLRLANHPRCSLSFYTSIMAHNVDMILQKIFKDDLEELRGKIGFFESSFCPKFDSNKQMKPLMQDEWDTYRDLDLVLADSECKKHAITTKNALLIDSEARKVQLDLANALCLVDYCRQDVEGKPR